MEVDPIKDTIKLEIPGYLIANPDNSKLNRIPSGFHDGGSIQDGLQETLEQKIPYRTKSRARKPESMPDKIPVITSPPWEYALSFHQNEYSFMLTTEPGDGADIHGGVSPPDACIWAGNPTQAFTQRTVPDIDLPVLHFLYGLVLKKWSEDADAILERYTDDSKQMLSYNITFYIPDFVRATGITANANKETVNTIMKRIKDYSGILVIVKEHRVGYGNTYTHYPVLVLIEYDESDNTITFASPFLNRIAMKTLYDSIRYDRQGNAMRSKSGKLNMKPSHSYRINSGILKERNKRAAEVACMVAALIDKAGNKTAHIRFRTIFLRSRAKFLRNGADVFRKALFHAGFRGIEKS